MIHKPFFQTFILPLVKMIFPSWYFFDRVGPLFKLQYRIQNQNEWQDVQFSAEEKFRWIHYFYNPQKTMWLYMNSLSERIGLKAINDPKEVQTALQKNLIILVQNWLGLDVQSKIELQILIQNPPKDGTSIVVWKSLS